jgi:hypothetical protein
MDDPHPQKVDNRTPCIGYISAQFTVNCVYTLQIWVAKGRNPVTLRRTGNAFCQQKWNPSGPASSHVHALGWAGQRKRGTTAYAISVRIYEELA